MFTYTYTDIISIENNNKFIKINCNLNNYFAKYFKIMLIKSCHTHTQVFFVVLLFVDSITSKKNQLEK